MVMVMITIWTCFMIAIENKADCSVKIARGGATALSSNTSAETSELLNSTLFIDDVAISALLLSGVQTHKENVM